MAFTKKYLRLKRKGLSKWLMITRKKATKKKAMKRRAMRKRAMRKRATKKRATKKRATKRRGMKSMQGTRKRENIASQFLRFFFSVDLS